MRRRASLSIVSSLLSFLAFVAAAASAQEVFVTPVPNAPFSAVVTIDRTIALKTGATVNFKSFSEIGRDSSGRIHNERRTSVADNSTPELRHVHIYDPQSRISTEINIEKKFFWTRTMNHAPSTEPPSIRFAAPDGNAPPSQFTKDEDLGMQEFDGVPAHGMRQTQTVVDENTGKDVVITDEYWYAQDLRIYLLVKHLDPRRESTITAVTQIKQTPPDRSFFEIPEGFKPRGAGQ